MSKTSKLDMTRMYIMHDALRRELERIAGASPEHTAAMLNSVPEPVRLAYHNEWQPTYAAVDLWAAR